MSLSNTTYIRQQTFVPIEGRILKVDNQADLGDISPGAMIHDLCSLIYSISLSLTALNRDFDRTIFFF